MTALEARPVKNRSLLPKPRSAPVLGRRPHPTKSWFFTPTNQAALVWRCPKTFPLRQPLAPSPPRFSGGEGRGEVVLIKNAEVPSPWLAPWFVGSNLKTPANEGLHPLPSDTFSPPFPVRQASLPAGCRTVPVRASFCPDPRPFPRPRASRLVPRAQFNHKPTPNHEHKH